MSGLEECEDDYAICYLPYIEDELDSECLSAAELMMFTTTDIKRVNCVECVEMLKKEGLL